MKGIGIKALDMGRVYVCLAGAFLALGPQPAEADWFRRAYADGDARDNENDPPPDVDIQVERARVNRSDGGASTSNTAAVLPNGFGQFALLADARAHGAGTTAFDEAGAGGGGMAEFFDEVRFLEYAVVNAEPDTIDVTAGFEGRSTVQGSGNAGAGAFLAVSREFSDEEDRSAGESFSGATAAAKFSLFVQYPDAPSDVDPITEGERFRIYAKVFAGANGLGDGAGGTATIETANPFGVFHPRFSVSNGEEALADHVPPYWINFRVLDADGSPVTGIMAVGDSGSVYPVNGTIVPEPGCLAILTLAAAAAPIRRTRRGRAPSPYT